MKRLKIKSWDARKEKKARFKRYLERARKRGDYIYRGFVTISDAAELIQVFDNARMQAIDDIGRQLILGGMNIEYKEAE